MSIKRIGRPAFKKARGTEAHTKFGKARKILGRVEERMQRTGQKFATWKRTESDGTEIYAAYIASPTGGPPVRILRIKREIGEGLVVVKVSCVIEVGCLAYLMDFEGYPDVPSYPLAIYTNDEVREYFDSVGTLIPNSADAYEYIVQEELPELVEARECIDETTNELIPSPDWPDTAPALVAGFPVSPAVLVSDEAYESVIFTARNKVPTTYCDYPALYSGLLRLAAQAKLGSGKSPAQLAPWTGQFCNLDSRYDGLFRDDNWVYWMFRCTDEGVKAQRMKVGSCAMCIWQALKDGDITLDEDKIKFETVVLASLLPDGRYAERELIDSTTMGTLYSGNRNTLGVIHAWHYSRGDYGDPNLTEAVIVLHDVYVNLPTELYHQATLARVEFDLTGDVPTAALVIDEEDQPWEPEVYDLIFYPTWTLNEGFKLCYVERDLVSLSIGSGAPIYAFYREDGLEVVRYSYRAAGTYPDDPYDRAKVCGASCDRIERLTTSGGSEAGAGGEIYTENTDVHLDMFSFSDPTTTLTYRREEACVAAAGEKTCCWGYANIPTQVRTQGNITECSGLSGYPWPGADYYTYVVGIGTADGEVRDWRMRAPIVKRHLIIPHGDSEAVYLIETLFTASLSTNTRNDVGNATNPPCTDIAIYTRAASDCSSARTLVVEFNNQMIIAAGFGLGIMPCNTTVNIELKTTENLPTGTDVGIVHKAKLVTSINIVNEYDGLSVDYDDWTEWYDVYLDLSSNGCTSKTQWTQTSFNYGDIWFSEGPSAAKSLFYNYDIAPDSELYKVAFIGWN